MKPVRLLLLVVPALLFAANAPAQEQPSAPLAPAAPQPAPLPVAPEAAAPVPTDPNIPTDIDAALARARAAYRAGPIAEQVNMHLRYADGRERTSTVTLRLDVGETGLARPRRIYLDLGRLMVAADDHAITAASPQEATLCVQALVSPPLTLPQLWEVVPPVQLPQLTWAFSPDNAMTDVMEAIYRMSWISVQLTREQSTIFRGTAPGGPGLASFDKSGRLLSLGVPLSKDGTRLDLTVMPLDANAGLWTIPVAGRRMVGSITELRPRPAPLAAGERLPALGLMSKEMEPYSLADDLAAPPTPELGRRTALALVVAYRGASPEALRDAQAGARAVASLRPHVLNELGDPALMPRFVACAAAFLDLADINRARLAALDATWETDADIVGLRRVYSPSGAAEFDRLAHGAAAAVLLLDAEQKVLASVPLDGRSHDDGGITRDLVAAIAAAVRGS